MGAVSFPRRCRDLTFAAVVVVSLVAFTGCSTTSDASEPLATIGLGTDLGQAGDPDRITDAVSRTAVGAEDINRVVMVGDSITRGATPALEAQFAAMGLDVVIEAENGKRMVVSARDNPGGADVVDFLSAAEGRDPASEVWVLALGTNDIGKYAGADEIAGAVNEVLDGVPDAAAVVWVDTYIRDLPVPTEVVNRVIRERVAGRGNAVVAPWTSFAEGVGVMSADGVHPTADGAEVFAGVVANTVNAFIR